MPCSLSFLLLTTMMPRNSIAYEYNPAVMEQHSLGNSVLDLVVHVPDQDGDNRSSENLKGISLPEPLNAKPTDEMVAEAGYPVETHVVTTDDGYLLRVHRIPGGKLGEDDDLGPRPPVFLQHGLLSSSADWVGGFQNSHTDSTNVCL